MTPQHSDAFQKLLAKDPALAARVTLWDSCGVYVRAWLFRMQLQARLDAK